MGLMEGAQDRERCARRGSSQHRREGLGGGGSGVKEEVKRALVSLREWAVRVGQG